MGNSYSLSTDGFFRIAETIKQVLIPVHLNVAVGVFVPIDIKLFREYISKEELNGNQFTINVEVMDDNSVAYIHGIGKEKKAIGKK